MEGIFFRRESESFFACTLLLFMLQCLSNIHTIYIKTVFRNLLH